MILRKSIPLLFALASLSVEAHAQGNVPYTRYALGTLFETDFPYLRGWGGNSAAFHNSLHFDFSNPASYGYLTATTLEAGGFGSVMHVNTGSSTGVFGDASITNLAIGFPVIRNKLTFCTGIVPFSNVAYDIVRENDSTSDFGKSVNTFNGKGGTYEFFLGSGLRVKNFSIGLNASYLFGTIDYIDILAFPDTLNAFNTRRQSYTSLGDFLFSGGVQYQFDFKKIADKKYKYSLDAGLDGNLQTNITAHRNELYERFTYQNINNVPTIIPKDTIFQSANERGTIIIPLNFSGGLIFTQPGKFSAGINFSFGQWSQYRSYNETDFTGNNWKLSGGTEYIPNSGLYYDYWKTVAYRIGARVGTNYLQYQGEKFPEYGISLGLGLPFRSRIATQISRIDIAGEWIHSGQLGTNPLITSLFRLSAGFSLNERWFQKVKFD